jgi:hypothetical protein
VASDVSVPSADAQAAGDGEAAVGSGEALDFVVGLGDSVNWLADDVVD